MNALVVLAGGIAAAVVAVLAIYVVIVTTVRLVMWWEVRQHRLDGLADPRVLRPVAKRMTWGK